MQNMLRTLLLFALLTSAALAGCGEDEAVSEADRLGVGAQCTEAAECSEDADACLTQFKGGYCGVQGCEADADCPSGSACIAHEDGNNYCFLVCTSKAECNTHRDDANAANCSSSATFVDDAAGRKACIPPSAGG